MNFNLATFQSLIRNKLFLAVSAVVILLLFAALVPLAYKFPGTSSLTDVNIQVPITPDIKILVLRVEPLPDQEGISTSPSIKIIFKDTISDEKITVNSSPKASFSRSVSPRGYTLTLTPEKNLKTETKYTLDIFHDKTKIYSWFFTTGTAGASPNIVEKIKRELPYEVDSFRITYSSASDTFVVIIFEKPVENNKKQALDWFRSQGLKNPDKEINITYLTLGSASN